MERRWRIWARATVRRRVIDDRTCRAVTRLRSQVRNEEASMSTAAAPRSEYVDFWNAVLVPKFVRWRHIIVDGLTLHSAKIFPSLAVKPGDKVVDAGCGFGDTAIQLARLIGPSGS